MNKVISLLKRNPDLDSKTIINILRVDKNYLLDIYKNIQNSPNIQNDIINNSLSPRFTIETSNLISQHSKYISDILLGKVYFPKILEFHSGMFCQCSCPFCFSNGYQYPKYLTGELPITTKVVEKIFSECRGNGVEEIWFSGGKESLTNSLTPDFIEIANDLGLKTRLYTNAIAINSSNVNKLTLCYQIRVSFNGIGAQNYKLLHFPNVSSLLIEHMYEKVLANIELLVNSKNKLSRECSIGLNIIIQPANYNKIIELAQIANNFGVDSIHIRREVMKQTIALSMNEIASISSQIFKVRKLFPNLIVDARGFDEGEFYTNNTQFLPGLKQPELCRAGLIKRGLSAWGQVFSCEFSEHPRFQAEYSDHLLGNINNESISEIFRKNVNNFPKVCKLCQAHEYGLNIAFEKLKNDLDFGIAIEEQPLYVKKKLIDEETNEK